MKHFKEESSKIFSFSGYMPECHIESANKVLDREDTKWGEKKLRFRKLPSALCANSESRPKQMNGWKLGAKLVFQNTIC